MLDINMMKVYEVYLDIKMMKVYEVHTYIGYQYEMMKRYSAYIGINMILPKGGYNWCS